MPKKTTRHYEEEFKRSSAKLASTSDQSVYQTAKALGVNENTLHGWVKKYHPKPGIAQSQALDLSEENKRLRKENARLKEERNILKKAAAYFASEIS